MAELGHDVVDIDIDAVKVQALSEGKAPFFEPGLPGILRSAGATGRLAFTTSMTQTAGASAMLVVASSSTQQKSAHAKAS